MAVERQARCWRYIRDCCRNRATSSVRIGSVVYHYCDEHDPLAAMSKKSR